MATPYAHVVCFVDDSDAARAGLAEAARLAEGARLTVVHVLAPPPWPVVVGTALGGMMNDPAALEAAARTWLEAIVEGVPGAEPVVLHGHAADESVRFLTESGADLAVAASHRGAVARAVLGSFAGFLAYHAPCAVLLVPPAARQA